MKQKRNPGTDVIAEIADRTGLLFDQAFSETKYLAQLCANISSPVIRNNLALELRHFSGLRAEVVRCLSKVDPLVFGIGVVLDAEVIPTESFSLFWIERDAEGVIRDGLTWSYPWRGDFYEYSRCDWMNLPRTLRKEVVVGPYIDCDDYIFTLAQPIFVKDFFLGVASADIRLDDYERILAPQLSIVSGNCAVVNAEGAVVVSNSVQYPVGARLDTKGLKSADCGNTGWRVVETSTNRR